MRVTVLVVIAVVARYTNVEVVLVFFVLVVLSNVVVFDGIE